MTADRGPGSGAQVHQLERKLRPPPPVPQHWLVSVPGAACPRCHAAAGPECEQRAGRQPMWGSRVLSEQRQAPPLLWLSAPKLSLFVSVPIFGRELHSVWLVTLEENGEPMTGSVAL